jgi:predicted nucleic acid-binding Zn ribbon protein
MIKSLAEIIEQKDIKFCGTIKICNLLSLWERVVDERVRKHTEPVKIKNQILYISTSSPAWAQELNFLKKKMIEKFNSAAKEEVINDIRFSARDAGTRRKE